MSGKENQRDCQATRRQQQQKNLHKEIGESCHTPGRYQALSNQAPLTTHGQEREKRSYTRKFYVKSLPYASIAVKHQGALMHDVNYPKREKIKLDKTLGIKVGKNQDCRIHVRCLLIPLALIIVISL